MIVFKCSVLVLKCHSTLYFDRPSLSNCLHSTG